MRLMTKIIIAVAGFMAFCVAAFLHLFGIPFLPVFLALWVVSVAVICCVKA